MVTIGHFGIAISHLPATLAALQLAEDDPEREVLEDGVLAVGLVPDVHLIPGLWKIDGYSSFTRMMTEAFELEMGSTFKDDGRTANYFEFAYDWRRDNRATARRLRRFVDDRLHRWRTNTPFKDAKSILVAHSMGGLVARYYPPGHSTLMLISIMPYAAARSWFPANAGEDWSKWRHSDEYEARKHELGERMIEAAETVVPKSPAAHRLSRRRKPRHLCALRLDELRRHLRHLEAGPDKRVEVADPQSCDRRQRQRRRGCRGRTDFRRRGGGSAAARPALKDASESNAPAATRGNRPPSFRGGGELSASRA